MGMVVPYSGKSRGFGVGYLDFSPGYYIYLPLGKLLKASESQLSYLEMRVLTSSWEYRFLDWRVDVMCQVPHNLSGSGSFKLLLGRP